MTLLRRRVLFFAEAVTLAHVARPVVLAQGLPGDRYETALAWSPRYQGLFPKLALPTFEIDSLASAEFARRLAAGEPIFRAHELDAAVSADRQLIRDWRPDVVVGDFRLSLGISARLEGVPYINIANAYWSPQAKRTIPVPNLAITRLLGVGLAQWIFNRVRPLAFAQHARAFERCRQRYGLKGYGHSLERAYTDGDRCLYADIPELTQFQQALPHEGVLGPILWEPAGQLPEWWNTLPSNLPLVYCTLGSSGDPSLLPSILSALADAGVTVVLATAGRAAGLAAYPNVYQADFLPGSAAAERSQLVICNGGSPTTQQAACAGRPILGICTNLDQLLNMQAIERYGAGLMLRSGHCSSADIRRAVEHLLRDARFAAAAQALAKSSAAIDIHARLGNEIERLVAEYPRLH